MMRNCWLKAIVLLILFSVIAGCGDNQNNKDQNQSGNIGGGTETSDTGE
ncbi:MAG TPA: hypothetical protein VEY68_15230 [Anoxybacillus sp.]|jgi:hypothetical protein|nr:hypothetical protein [Anoxybacillus sp.]